MEEKYIRTSRTSTRVAPHRASHKVPVRRKKKNLIGRIGKTIYGAVVAVSALIVSAYAALTIFAPAPDIAPEIPNPDTTQQGGEVESPIGTPTDDVEELPLTRQRREKVYTFLLAGTDNDGTRTDTMIVMRYDVPNQTVGLVSVPRDTLVKRAAGKNPKLVYGSGGVTNRRDEIANLLGIPIDFYVKVDLSGFIALVDYVGGVDFYVPCSMSYDDPYQNLSIHFKEGMQHLNGKQTMQVARFRKNNDGSGYTDVGRTQTQQQLLVALAKKVLSWGSLSKLNGVVEIFNTYVETDLTLANMLYFASQAMYLDTATGLETTTLEGDGNAHYGNYSYCYALDEESTLETVNRLLNPYDQEITLDDMNILSGK